MTYVMALNRAEALVERVAATQAAGDPTIALAIANTLLRIAELKLELEKR